MINNNSLDLTLNGMMMIGMRYEDVTMTMMLKGTRPHSSLSALQKERKKAEKTTPQHPPHRTSMGHL